MATMKAMQIQEAGGEFVAVDLPVPEPGPGEVRVRVEACGICHSDVFVKENLWPELELPRVPGHEVIGIVDAVGPETPRWETGDRVGLGWHGGHCFHCRPCREGDFLSCEQEQVAGISYDGGYAEFVRAPWNALAAVPEGLEPVEAAPLLCAGITTYNALRHVGARAGDTVAVLGVGGLGHLALQYASAMGFRTVALSTSSDKEEMARQFGADAFIDTSRNGAAEPLQEMGGARVILSTAPNSEAITGAIDGLGRNGELVVLGVDEEPIRITPLQLIQGRASLRGWPSGDVDDAEDTLLFSAEKSIRPKTETFPLGEANAAYDRMITNEARFRVVLTP